MSWFSKVAWSEGLFLRPHHLQQADRYVERLIETRVRSVTPYPWGFSALEIDRDLAQQSKFGLRRAAGVMPDGTPFDLPQDSTLPPAIDIKENAAKQIVWLSLPIITPNSREIDGPQTETGSRYIESQATVIDSNSSLRIEEQIDIAQPRLTLDLRKTPKGGHVNIGIARIVEVRDKACRRFWRAMRIRSSTAGWTGLPAGSTTSWKSSRVMPPTRQLGAACRPSTISSFSFSTGI
jgi:type VI secretion system protein ImpJ